MYSSGHHVSPKSFSKQRETLTGRVWRFMHHHLVSLQSGVESGSTEPSYALKQLYRMSNNNEQWYKMEHSRHRHSLQFQDQNCPMTRLWTSIRALVSITQYFDLQQKTYMEWRKYKKRPKKITDHTFQKGIVLKMSRTNLNI